MERGSTQLALLALCAALTGPAIAEDHPIAGDRLVLKDTGAPAARRFKFRAAKDAGLDLSRLGDPTALGAMLEVVGDSAGDGDTGPLTLDAARWTALGSPPGSRGYRYLDRARSVGVKRVLLKARGGGATVTISGGGPNWPYAVTQAQGGPIDVRLTIGTDVLCGRFAALKPNAKGKVKGASSSPPPSCTPGPPAVCGNGDLESGEQCDDGNTDDGDGCSSACRVELAGLCTGVPTTPGTSIGAVRVASGLDKPLYVATPPLDTGRLFIVGQEGTIQILQNGTVRPTPFLDLTESVSCCGERGLLGLAFHPDFWTTGYFFVDYTNNAGNTVIARYTVSGDPNVADAGSALVLMTINQPFSNHNGGQLAFGPDGMLYVGMGDGGSGGDPGDRAQDPRSLLGKILRLDVDRAGPPWGAADNPSGDEIWSLGWRNPWRFSFDRANGDLYVGDVGQDVYEEIDVEPHGSPGALNYGWRAFEGEHCYQNDSRCDAPQDFVMPVLEYTHDDGCSVTGGYVYRGCAMPDLRGTYFYADFCSAFIRTFKGVSDGSAQNREDRTSDLAPGDGMSIDSISSFGEDARGELYITDLNDGELYKIVPGS